MGKLIVTRDLHKRITDVIAKYPDLDNNAIAMMMIGSGACKSISYETIRRVKNSRAYDEYVKRLNVFNSTGKDIDIPNANDSDEECDIAYETQIMIQAQRIRNERLNEACEILNNTCNKLGDTCSGIIEISDCLIDINETLKTIAILISALLNEWRGTVKTVEENIKEA